MRVNPWQLRVLLVVCLTVVAAVPAVAAEPVDATARAIEGQVWSPYCPGRLLAECTTQQAQDLRDEISRRLRSGESVDEVMAWLRRNYGEQVLAKPRSVGLWLVPLGVLLAATALAYGLVRRSRRTPVERDLVDDEWVQRVREEVARSLDAPGGPGRRPDTPKAPTDPLPGPPSSTGDLAGSVERSEGHPGRGEGSERS